MRARSRARLLVEELEPRCLLRATALPADVTAVPAVSFAPAVTNPTPVGYTPAQVQHAYGFDQVPFLAGNPNSAGQGQTIAIVDAYDDPNIAADLHVFD